MNYPPIHTLVPHGGAMVLLDRVLHADDESLCAEVRIRPDSLFCQSEGVGAWAGVEYMAQAIAAHAGFNAQQRGDPVKLGFLLGARRYECSRSAFTVGSVLHVHVRRSLQSDNGLGAFECQIDLAGEGAAVPLANATVTVYQPHDAGDFLQGHSE